MKQRSMKTRKTKPVYLPFNDVLIDRDDIFEGVNPRKTKGMSTLKDGLINTYVTTVDLYSGGHHCHHTSYENNILINNSSYKNK